MRLSLPLTGTVLIEGDVRHIIGDPEDPIRAININLGSVSWKLVDIDLENEVMVVEARPTEEVDEPTGEVDGGGEPICRCRKTTAQEKTAFLQHAKHLIEGHTKDELHAMSKCPRLKRPFRGK